MQIVYSGNMTELSNLPFHVLVNNQTIVFKRHILDIICDNNLELFNKYFNEALLMQELVVEGQVSYPLLRFVAHSNNINCDSFAIKNKDKSKEEKQLFKKLHPLTMALAKIGAKVHFNEMEPGETPSSIFEKELIKGI